jgi:integrase
VSLGRILPRLGQTHVTAIDAPRVAALVAGLHAEGLKRQTIRKTVSVLAMILDHAGAQPNPARDRTTVRLPREERRHVQPPTAEHVEAVVRLLPASYRLPALVLDATGMRVGELERLTWGDVDEPRARWRVSAAVAKTGQARWVHLPEVLFEAVCALVARDDRTPERRVFQGFGGRSVPYGADASVHGRRSPHVLAARPPPPARLPPPPRRRCPGPASESSSATTTS